MKLLLIYFIVNAIIHGICSIIAYFDEDSEIRDLIDNHKEIYDSSFEWIFVMILGILIGVISAIPQLIGLIIILIVKKVRTP